MRADVERLHHIAQRLRRISVLSTTEAGSGHPSTCLSAAEIMSVLFFHEMRWDPRDPRSDDQDHFVLSKGHAAPILWAALSEAGAIAEDPMTLRKIDSPLEGHPTPHCPWVRVATGSLGQGLCAAVGMAHGKRIAQHPSRVYCLLGDGELAEGSVIEAAQAAAHAQLGNVCAVLDVNGLGQSGATMYGHDIERVAAPFAAVGWNVVLVDDGHDLPALLDAFAKAAAEKSRPTVIACRTFKGKGIKDIENRQGWHGKPIPKGPALEKALAEIGESPRQKPPEPRPYGVKLPSRAPRGDLAPPAYAKGAQVATREAYGDALAKLGKIDPTVVALDGDTKNSTFSERLLKECPERFIEAYIAEQNMVGMSLGLAAMGYTPFASTFAAFLSRAYDFIRMATYSRPRRMILTGSHAGVSIGEDGASQMALEDLAMMRAVLATTVFYPCDAVSTERLVAAAAQTEGITYIRTSRPKTPVIYDANETFVRGGSKVVRKSDADTVTLVGAGVTLHHALTAADELAKEGVRARVIDLYSLKPIDAATLQQAARDTRRVITVEDHAIEGGIGEAVCAAVTGLAPVTMLAVTRIPRSGTPEQLLEYEGISPAAIVRAVRSGS